MAKRVTREERQAKEAQRLAALLVAEGTGVTVSPALLGDPRLASARQAWNDYAPRLAALGTLDELSRLTLALLCIYVSDFVIAEDDILTHGFSVRVKTVSGDFMPRENPAVARRDHAARMVLEIGKHFGLTMLDRIGLLRGRTLAPDDRSLFEPQRNRPSPPPPAEPASEDERDWHRLISGKLN